MATTCHFTALSPILTLLCIVGVPHGRTHLQHSSMYPRTAAVSLEELRESGWAGTEFHLRGVWVGWVQPPPPPPGGAEWEEEALKVPKKFFRLNYLAPKAPEKFLIGRRPGAKLAQSLKGRGWVLGGEGSVTPPHPPPAHWC